MTSMQPRPRAAGDKAGGHTSKEKADYVVGENNIGYRGKLTASSGGSFMNEKTKLSVKI